MLARARPEPRRRRLAALDENAAVMFEGFSLNITPASKADNLRKVGVFLDAAIDRARPPRKIERRVIA